ncbi:MAG TPA: hypothetical protein VJT74_12100, partial [Pyrinomonadaceae bacterium]|nr:hypothetical protein [Pyrinomonadaceae bacterium]
EGQSPLFGNLSDFTGRLLKLRLAELKSFRVEAADAVPPCGDGQGPDQTGTAQVSLANEADFYALRSSLEVRAPESSEVEIVLNYELTKCVRREIVSLTRIREPFAEPEVLKYLNSMADVVALLLEKERTVTKMFVEADTVPADAKSAGLARKLTEEVEAGIKQATDFDLPEKAARAQPVDFKIRGEVSVTDKVVYRVRIEPKGRPPYTVRTVTGPDANKQTEENLAAFYKNAATAALDYLRFVRYVAEARRNTDLSDEEAAQMLERARRLMCVGSAVPAGCKEQPETAILILTEVRDRRKVPDFALLGRAQMLVGEYYDAAESFDKARDQAGRANAETLINLLNQSGEAWFKAKNYKLAIERYKESLRLYSLNRSQLPDSLLQEEPKVQLQMARSYRYNMERVEALKVLLDSWAAQRDPKEMQKELGYLLEDMSETDLPEAARVVETYRGQPAYEVVRPMLQDRLALNSLLDSLLSYGLRGLGPSDEKAIFDEMDKALTSVEAIPEASLSVDTRVLRRTLRAMWYRDYKNDFEQALPLLEQAAAIKDTSLVGLGQLLLADTYYKKAQRPETTDPRTFYEKASSVSTDLTKLGVSEAYGILVTVNHKLGKDEESRRLLEAREKEEGGENDLRAEAFSRLCTHYLFDLECGLRNAQAMSTTGGAANVMIAEIQLFKGEYAEAQKGFADERSSLPKPLALFYRTWTLFALKKDAEARAAAQEWATSLGEFRKAGEADDLILEGARRALDNETHLTQEQTQLLRAMLAAMADKSSPLPLLP